jgi:hypothetical protein
MSYAIMIFDIIERFVYGVRYLVLNVTFNNISVISWRSVLLVEETGVPGENHQPATSHIKLNIT